MHQRKMKKGVSNKLMSVLMMVLLTFMMFPFTSIVQPPVAAYASEGETVMYLSIGDYIASNIDEQLVEVQEETDQGILGMLRSLFGQVDTTDMKPASYIYANYTLIDSSMSNGATTLEQVWDETPEAIAGTYPTYSPVYDFGKDTDYLVMFLEQPSMTESAHFLYADFNTLDLDDPISLNDDVIYDHDSGIAYIPKTGLDLFDEENPYEVIELQVQLVYENDFSANAAASTKIDLSIENNNGKVTAVSPQKQLELSTFDTVSYFQIATESTASAIDVTDLDVYINGNEQPMDKVMEGDDYNIAYNPANGYMAIAQSPLTITSIKVVINGGDLLSSLSPEKSYAATFNRYLPEHMSWLRDDSGYAKLTNLDWDSLFVGQCFKYTAAKLRHSDKDVDNHPSKKYCYDVTAQGGFAGVVKYFYSERDQNDKTFNFEWIDKAITDGVYQGTTTYPGGTPAAGGDNAGVFDPPNGNGAYWHSIISHPTGVLTDMEGNKQDFTGEWCYDELATLCGHASNGGASFPADLDTQMSYDNVPAWTRIIHKATDANGDNYIVLSVQIPIIDGQQAVGLYRIWVESKGNIEIQKSSTDSRTDSNPNYDFNGIEYSVTNSKGENVGTIALDANGYGSLANVQFDTYTIKETKTNEYFKLDTNTYTETLDGSDTKKSIGGKLLPTQSFSVVDEPQYIGFFLDKESANPSVTANNKMYTLAGAEYTITNTRTGKVEEVMVTDENGHAESKTKLLVDDYTVKETKATNKHFAIDTNTYTYKAGTPKPGTTQKVTKANGANLTDEAKVDISLNIYKQEQQSEGNVGLGATTLRDAVYKIEYWDVASEADKANATPEHHRTWYVRTDDAGYGDIQTITTEKFSVETTQANSRKIVREFQSDEPYRQNGKIIIPMGYIEITEVSNPAGHFFDNGTDKGPGVVQKYSISNGDQLTAQYEYSIVGDNISKDEAYRGDYKFTKIREATQEALAGVPFLITSKTTGESHVVVTDRNGAASTEASWNSHIDNTNVNDAAFTQDADGNWILKEGASLDDLAGVWFTGHGPKKTLGSGYDPKPKDSVGALPYDSYVLQELACEQNKGMTLVTREFTIERHGVTVDGNTISDHDITIQTTATDKNTGDHIGDPSIETVIIADEVSYSNLVPDTKYTMTGTLMDKKTGEPLKDANGNTFVKSVPFTPTESDGTIVIEFEVPGSVLVGKTTVVFESLHDSVREVAIHADINDEKQTVDFPGLHTTATDSVTGEHEGQVTNEEIIVRDEVAYSGLRPGQEYEIRGTLMDKATGSALVDTDGNTFTANVKFTPDSEEGTVTLEFKIPRSVIAGKTVVAFEYLYQNNKEIGKHADIDDEEQTVYYPDVHTTATDNITGNHIGYADETVTINDIVKYENLLYGKKYRVDGVLMDKATGEALNDADGKEITASAEFVAGIEPTSEMTAEEAQELVDAYLDVMPKVLDIFAADEVNKDEFPQITKTADEMKALVESMLAGDVIDDADKDVIAALDEFYLSMTDEQKAETGELVSPEKLEEAVNVIVEDKDDTTEADADVELDEALIGTRVSGEVLVSFTAPKSAVEGKQTVVFEELYGESGVTGEFIIVGDHKDINDEGQTVYYPEIKTLAHSDDPNSPHNAQIDFATNMVKFTDTITYKNLMPGEKYRAEGVLMDKQAGTELIDGNTNNKITASTEFVPESPDGTVDVVFEFDASNIGIDYSSTNIADTIKETVVFEDVYLVGNGVADDIIIGKHADLNDEDQSMLVGNFLADELIETGGEILPLGDAGFIVAALIAINAGLYAYWMRFRRKEDLA